MQTSTKQESANQIYILGPDEGRHLHVLDNLGSVKTKADGSQAMAVIEFTALRGFGPPAHLHEDEDEFLYVLEGEVNVHIDDEVRSTTAGTFVWLPRNVPHTFQVVSETARMLSATAGSLGPMPSFDAMMVELGNEVSQPTMPDPMDIDPGHVAAVSARHGVKVIGPPPAALA